MMVGNPVNTRVREVASSQKAGAPKHFTLIVEFDEFGRLRTFVTNKNMLSVPKQLESRPSKLPIARQNGRTAFRLKRERR